MEEEVPKTTRVVMREKRTLLSLLGDFADKLVEYSSADFTKRG